MKIFTLNLGEESALSVTLNSRKGSTECLSRDRGLVDSSVTAFNPCLVLVQQIIMLTLNPGKGSVLSVRSKDHTYYT